MLYIGPACKEWREGLGISQAHIARQAGVTRSHVSHFERGEVGSNRLLFTYIRLGFPATYDMLLQYLGGS